MSTETYKMFPIGYDGSLYRIDTPQETKLITMTIETYNELIRKSVLYDEIMKEADSEIIDPTGRYEGC